MNRKTNFFILLIFISILFTACPSQITEEETEATTTVQAINAIPPTIITNPLSARAVVPAECTFSCGAVSEDGGTLSYQWYFLSDEDAEAVMIENATNSTYTAEINSIGKNGYYCIITNTIEDNGDGGTKTTTATTETAWLEAIKLSDVLDSPVFTVQPAAMCLLKNESHTFSCVAELSNYSPVYRWFKTDEKGETKTAITDCWSSSSKLEVEGFSEKGIRYYICLASPYIPNNDEIPEKAVFSNVTAVAYTGLPIVQIDTVNQEEPTADYVSPPAGCYGGGLKNHSKVPGQMKIIKDGQDVPIFNSGLYDKTNKTGITLKLRGNTSAYGKKKPYKIKLQTKADLLSELIGRNDSKYEDKEWILLKDATSLNTFIGMTVADLTGTDWTPEFAFVNVIINNDYRGTYLLIEAISKGEKRIDINDDGYIIERDAYWWNEDIKFITNLNQKYTFKYPNDDNITTEQINFIEDYMNKTESQIQSGEYEDYIDTESFARWQLIHDILGSSDAGGSNIYESKSDCTSPENTKEDGTWSKIKMSTPWDFDRIYQQKDNWSSVHYTNRIYSQLLFSSQNTAFMDSYKSQWENIKSTLWSDLSTKLNELKISQGEDINLSGKCDATRWNGTFIEIEYDISMADSWFTSRIIWLDTAINAL